MLGKCGGERRFFGRVYMLDAKRLITNGGKGSEVEIRVFSK